jgi:hypothetical protein
LLKDAPVIPKPIDRQKYLDAVETLKILLQAEDGFFSALERSATGDPDTADLAKFLHHDETLHFARFFFLFETFDVTDEVSVGRFIDNHNKELSNKIRDEQPGPTRERELRNAAISPERRFKIQNYFMTAGEPAFDRKSLEQFLYAHVKRTQMHDKIKKMLEFGFLEERVVEFTDVLDAPGASQDIGASRKLIVLAKNRVLVSAYADYLLEARTEIAATVAQATAPAPAKPLARTEVLEQ